MNNVSFSLTHKAINDHIIKLLKEGNLLKAYSFFEDELVSGGFPEDAITPVLKGDFSISTENNELVLIDKPNNEIKKIVSSLREENNNKFFIDGQKLMKLEDVIEVEDVLNVINTNFSLSSLEMQSLIKLNFLKTHENLDNIKIFYSEEDELFLISSYTTDNQKSFIIFLDLNLIGVDDMFKSLNKESLYHKKLKDKLDKAIIERNVEFISVSVLNNFNSDEESDFIIPKEIGYAYSLNRFDHKFVEAYKMWNPISPVGVKMTNDSPYHTDLWLALGFPMDHNSLYGDTSPYLTLFFRIVKAVHSHMHKNKSYDFLMLSQKQGGKFKGKILFHDTKQTITDRDILILPNANAQYLDKALKAGCVIVEKGGQLSHIVIVSREDMLPIILMEGAQLQLSENKEYTIDFDKNKIF